MISLVQKERFDLEEKTRNDVAVILSALQFHLNGKTGAINSFRLLFLVFFKD